MQIKRCGMSAERFNTWRTCRKNSEKYAGIMNATEKEAVNDTMDNIKKLVRGYSDLQIPSEKEEEPQEKKRFTSHIRDR